MRRSVVLAWLSSALLACGTESTGTIDAPLAIDAKPGVDTPVVVTPDAPPSIVDAASAVDTPIGVTPDTPPTSIDAPPPIDVPPPPIDAPPPIDSPPGDPCGNGVVDPGEKCDVGIAQGNPGACPTDCNDSDVCTDDALVGTRCQQECTHTPKTPNPVADGCCPIGATGLTDPDCAVCGNGIVELGEVCDDHNMMSGDGCSYPACTKEIVGYRIDTLVLKYPHVMVPDSSFVCRDLTNMDVDVFVIGQTTAINTQIVNVLTKDGDGDQLLDLSPVIAFKPFDQHGASTPVDVVFADCALNPPSPPTPRCTGAGATRISATATNTESGAANCLGILANTVRTGAPDYQSTIVPSGPPPCFVTDTHTIQLSVAGINITLEDARIAAVYSGDPASQLVTGLLVGFLSEATAEQTPIPGTNLVTLAFALPGGNGGLANCATWDDRKNDGNVSGWWFYLNFTAVRETYVDQ